MRSNPAIILTEFSRRGRLNFVNRYAAVYCEVANRNIAGSRQFATRVFPSPRVVFFNPEFGRLWWLTLLRLPTCTLAYLFSYSEIRFLNKNVVK